MEGPPLLITHAAATWALVGLIWVVQVVLYPQFADIGGAFRAYHERYMRLITWVVGPLMAVEVATAVLVWANPPAGVPAGEALVGLVLVGALWASTGLWAVPLHGRLERGFDARTAAALVRMNILRTLLWTARGALVARWLWAALGEGASS